MTFSLRPDSGPLSLSLNLRVKSERVVFQFIKKDNKVLQCENSGIIVLIMTYLNLDHLNKFHMLLICVYNVKCVRLLRSDIVTEGSHDEWGPKTRVITLIDNLSRTRQFQLVQLIDDAFCTLPMSTNLTQKTKMAFSQGYDVINTKAINGI